MPLYKAGKTVLFEEARRRKRPIDNRPHRGSMAENGSTIRGESNVVHECKGVSGGVIQDGVEVVGEKIGGKGVKDAEYGYYLNCFQERIGTNNKDGMAQRAADCTASVRAMNVDYRTELYGTIQTVQSDRYLTIVNGTVQRVSDYGIGGDRHAEMSSINMVMGCPVVENPVLLRAFMIEDYSLLSFQAFMKDKAILQCDAHVSADDFHGFINVMYLLEISTVTFMGRHWDKVTLNFRNDISSIEFPFRKVTTQVMVALTWEAIKDTWSTIATKEKEEKWGIRWIGKDVFNY